jgi:hypothetical protein
MSRTIRNTPRAKRSRKNQAPAYRRHVPTNVTRAMLRALAYVNTTTDIRKHAC